MRISTQSLFQNAMRGLRANLATLSAAQNRAASGRRVRTVSDDPMDAAQIMRLDGRLRDIEQFRRNGMSATTRLGAEDQVLTTVQDLLQRARDLAVTAASLPVTDPMRATASSQVDDLREQVLSLANTRVGDIYIFGGGGTVAPPFNPSGAYAGDANVQRVELDDGVLMDTNHTGVDLFSNALAVLSNLSAQVAGGSTVAITAAGTNLAAEQQRALVAQAEVGARLLQVRTTGESLARRSVQILDRRDALRDADPAESLLEVSAAQSALERAYAVVSRVLSTSLVDYLR